MSRHVPSAFKRWWLILWEQFGGGSGSGASEGLTVEEIDTFPTNVEGIHHGDRFIMSKGMEPATIIGTCSGVSSDPNTTIINGVSISLDAGLNAVDFAAAIVQILNFGTNLADAGLQSADDNGDGTFELDFDPGVFANSVVCSGTDNNPSFEVTYPGSSVLQQVDERKILDYLHSKLRPYRVLTGRLWQVGTDPPSIQTINEDTIGVDDALTLTRSAPGVYSIVLTDPSPFGQRKVWFTMQTAHEFGNGGGCLIAYFLSDGGLDILTGAADFVTPAFTLQDELLYHSVPFELRIYD